MKNNEVTITTARAAANSNRHMNENEKKTAAILDKYKDCVKRDISRELSDTLYLAKVRASIAYVSSVLGEDSKYTQSIERALTDSDFANACATTTDTSSVEWFVGRVMSGSTGDVAKVLRNVLGASLRAVGLQMKRLCTAICSGGLYDDTDFTGAQLNITKANIQALYGKKYKILEDESILSDVCAMCFYKLHKK